MPLPSLVIIVFCVLLFSNLGLKTMYAETRKPSCSTWSHGNSVIMFCLPYIRQPGSITS